MVEVKINYDTSRLMSRCFTKEYVQKSVLVLLFKIDSYLQGEKGNMFLTEIWQVWLQLVYQFSRFGQPHKIRVDSLQSYLE